MNSEFVSIALNVRNIDRYVIRKSIFDALGRSLTAFQGKLLDAGCGKMPYKKWILKNSSISEYVGLDIETALVYDSAVRPDYTWNGRVMPFEDNAFDCCLATEVLEHCPEPEVFLREVNRVLIPGGVFFFTVPFLWNLHEVPHDEYRYTPFSLERHLRNSGFTEINIKATGGWHAAMAQMLGLWVKRSGLNRVSKKVLSILFLPLMKWLLSKDSKTPIAFTEGIMITGLHGTARKC